MKKFFVLACLALWIVGSAASAANSKGGAGMRIKITVNGKTLTAMLEDNPTSRAFMAKLPLTLPMLDLYGREMCYHFDTALPTDKLVSTNYEVGDLIYWPPRHSFVILYKQNGERFERQHVGRIDSGVEIFDGMGDADVLFEAE